MLINFSKFKKKLKHLIMELHQTLGTNGLFYKKNILVSYCNKNNICDKNISIWKCSLL